MKREATVIGQPISHSLSPAIFGFLAHQRGLSDLRYGAREIAPVALPEFVRAFRDNPRGVGFNVTIPHKEAILPLLDDVAAEARAIGAVNVVQRANGKLRGHNTDVHGVLTTLRKHQTRMEGETALILGAGGAARAAAYALGQEGAEQVMLFNPRLERAQALVKQMQPHFSRTRFQTASSWDELHGRRFSLVVQSTPLGMSSQPETREGVPASDFFSKLRGLSFTPEATAFDLIYRPERTPFLGVSQALGLKTIGGMEMLIGQALETWRIWFEENVDIDLGNFLRHRPIFLTGFMGAGKSTVGPLLAKLLGWNFLEVDLAIEKEAALTIPEIFKEKGEAHFRALESRIIARNAFSPRTVVALGGGALSDPETRDLLSRSCRLVFLSADSSTLGQRLGSASNQRPVLAGLTGEQRQRKIESLLKDREPFYNQCAFKLDTASISAEQAAQKIRDHFRD